MSVFDLKFEMNNGYKIPALGLGTWQAKTGDMYQAVKNAIDIGYRHLDCALVYNNEKEVGKAIKEKISQGIIKREDLFITSKVWNSCHKFESVEKSVMKSLNNLGLDYLDLCLMHWPIAYEDGDDLFPMNPDGTVRLADIDYLETWRGLEAVHKKGLAKSIGLSNFNSEQITKIIENCSIKPVLNQVECHPYLTQQKLSQFCKERNILITAYSPLGSPDRPWAKPGDPKLLDDAKLHEISKKYNKTPAQVLIRYQIDRGHVVVPKSVTSSRIIENFQVFDFKLSQEDVSYINTFDCNERICVIPLHAESRYYPFNIEF